MVKGGLDTAAEPLYFVEGAELSIGLFAEDPEGYTMLGDNFTVFVNGVRDELFEVQGDGPFYRVVRTGEPLPQGEYKIRIQVSDPDGVSGSSQPLDIRISSGFDPVIKMVSLINEKVNYIGKSRLDTLAFPSTAHFTYEARDFDGIINSVKFYANSQLIGEWSTSSESDSNDTGAGTWREGDTNRFTIAWSPDYAGTFNISASAEDNSYQSNFSQVAQIKFVSPYRQGSLPPKVFLRYPDAGPRLDSSPLVMETESYTSTSIIPLISRAYDLDGSLETLNYYVDGVKLLASTGYIQVIDKPEHGDVIRIFDGMNPVLSFTFAEDNSTALTSFTIPISPKFEELRLLNNCLEILVSGQNLSANEEQDALVALRYFGIDRVELPAPSLLEEILIGLDSSVLDEQRNIILQAILEEISKAASFHASAEMIGMNGVYFRHANPALAQNAFVDIVGTNVTSRLKAKTFTSGLVRFPSIDSENYHFTQLWTPSSPGIFTIGSTAIDGSGNEVFSSTETITVTLGSSAPIVSLTSPISGTQRSVSQVGKHAIGSARNVLVHGFGADGTILVELAEWSFWIVVPDILHLLRLNFLVLDMMLKRLLK